MTANKTTAREINITAALMGVPVGVASGVYLSEYGRRGRFAFCVRYAADVMNGVPSIVVGLFVYALIVHPMKKFSKKQMTMGEF